MSPGEIPRGAPPSIPTVRGGVLGGRIGVVGGVGAIWLAALGGPLSAQKKEVIPHAQDRMPGPALSPAEALKKMVVPKGFTVELVASEPDIVNPVAMTFDER